ncbi:hypothetical protein RF11_01728 [Thelohanellus kitauei]|uniref:Tc3 transposase DNA binding domain-containing protein n=1 Tax=Thelohanellus kitauei TaxID=669202 RepID=A0A0C2J3R1_THEKT|nr:hypothetical protein RF11_01728 [Thelohanellus kitauei]
MGRGKSLTKEEQIKITAFMELGLTYQEVSIRMNRSIRLIKLFCSNPSEYEQNMKKIGEKKDNTDDKLQEIVQLAICKRFNVDGNDSNLMFRGDNDTKLKNWKRKYGDGSRMVECLIGDWPVYIMFQQDNAPPHVFKSTLAFFKNKDIKLIEWPSYSPGLNSIENVLSKLSSIVYIGFSTYLIILASNLI